MHDTLPLLGPSNFPAIHRKQLEIVQINIGLRCNLACLHCHTNSNPYRKEAMATETIDLLIDYINIQNIKILDITGGAPELHPEFRNLVRRARKDGVHVIDRCNLTILEAPEQENLDQFLAENRVEIVASLPCYTKDNADAQRGKGVFDSSIRVLQRLNQLGYGKPDTGLMLNLVYNPLGPDLPPNQDQLEQIYKKELAEHFDIEQTRPMHIGFGTGEHTCIGNRLAEVQISLMFSALDKRFPELLIVGPGRRMRSNFINGFLSLPARLN